MTQCNVKVFLPAQTSILYSTQYSETLLYQAEIFDISVLHHEGSVDNCRNNRI
jgi:hypothetical protein